MIYGIGTDIAQVKRFQKWVSNPSMLSRFFNENEMFSGNINEKNDEALRHYAARFAAKEAFSKALGTGLVDLSLKDFYIAKNHEGKPYFVLDESVKKILHSRIGSKYNIQLSISHEKDYAVAFVLIEV